MALAAASMLMVVAAEAQVASDPHDRPAPADAQSSSTQGAAYRGRLSDSDATALRSALAAARSGARDRFAAASTQISDTDARKLATWAMVDSAGEGMSFYELDRARTELAAFPRAAR